MQTRAIRAAQRLNDAYPAIGKFDGRKHSDVLVYCRVHEDLDAAKKLVQSLSERLCYVKEPSTHDDVRVAQGVNAARSDLARGYSELLRTGFAKVIEFRTENGDIEVWRIGQANISELTARVVNRLAPIAGILISARAGAQIELPCTGEVTVLSVTGLDGFSGSGPDFARAQIGDTHVGMHGVRSLQSSLASWLERGPTSESPQTATERRARPPSAGEGMDARFYVNTTAAQEAILRAPDQGLLAVHGIAGSGKTAIALGRVKALCDARFETEDPTTHFFQPDLCRGFVLRRSLTEYLRVTCAQLQLQTMPVQDIEDLRLELAQHFGRLLGLSSARGRVGYVRDEENARLLPRELDSLSFLRLLDRVVLNHWCDQAIAALSKPAVHAPSLPIDTVDAIHVIRERAKSRIESFRGDKLRRDGWASEGLVQELIAIGEEAMRRARSPVRERTPNWWLLKNGHLAPDDEGSKQIEAKGVDPFRRDRFRTDVQKEAIEAAIKSLRQRMAADLGLSLSNLPDFGAAYLKASEDALSDDPASRKNTVDMIRAKRLVTPALDAMLAVACLATAGCADLKTTHLRSPTLARHIFIDEYQDFSEMELALMILQADPCKKRCVTVAGDPLQHLSAAARPSLEVIMTRVFQADTTPIVLLENLRQSPPLAELSLAYRRDVLRDQTIPSISSGQYEALSAPYRRTVSNISEAIVSLVLETDAFESTAVLCANDESARQLAASCRGALGENFRAASNSLDSKDLVKRGPVHFTTADAAKGLEFHTVIVAMPSAFLARESAGVNALYVAISRARTTLHLLETDGVAS